MSMEMRAKTSELRDCLLAGVVGCGFWREIRGVTYAPSAALSQSPGVIATG